jgi:hypothetical protein
MTETARARPLDFLAIWRSRLSDRRLCADEL